MAVKGGGVERRGSHGGRRGAGDERRATRGGYLETHVFGRFSFGYGMLGPTEVRLVLIALNALAFFMGPERFMVLGVGVTVLDLAGLVVTVAMLGLLVTRSWGNLRELARLEPANVRREG